MMAELDSSLGAEGIICMVKPPTRCTHPQSIARNCRKRVISISPSGDEKYREASKERNVGERPKRAMLVPAAAPIYFGKFFEAAKTDEK
jgi:hypothetical protein